MLYYKSGLLRRIRIHPEYSGGKHDPIKIIRKMLNQEIRENPFSTEYGYIVDKISVDSIKDGYCLPHTGLIEFLVTFDAIVLYPMVGEVVDATVEMITDTCIIFKYVCVYGVVRSYCLNEQDYFKYEERDVGTEEEKKCKAAIKEGLFRSQTDSTKLIEKGTVVRVRVTRRTLGGNGFFLVGSMSSEHLGPFKNPPPPLVTLNEAKRCVLHELPNLGIPSNEIQKMLSHKLFSNNGKKDSDEDDNCSIASLTVD